MPASYIKGLLTMSCGALQNVDILHLGLLTMFVGLSTVLVSCALSTWQLLTKLM